MESQKILTPVKMSPEAKATGWRVVYYADEKPPIPPDGYDISYLGKHPSSPSNMSVVFDYKRFRIETFTKTNPELQELITNTKVGMEKVLEGTDKTAVLYRRTSPTR